MRACGALLLCEERGTQQRDAHVDVSAVFDECPTWMFVNVLPRCLSRHMTMTVTTIILLAFFCLAGIIGEGLKAGRALD